MSLFLACHAAGASPQNVANGRDVSSRRLSANAQATTQDLGVDREIWIALRQDGLDGAGTLADPFNGSGPRLDALLRDLSETRGVTNIAIHLLPGVFETEGVRQWHPLSGWKIRGAGIDVTTLKLVNASNNVFSVVYTATRDTEYIEVTDLTVDCNYSPINPNFAHAVVLAGSHHRIQRVKAVHAYGLQPIENFTLAIVIGLKEVSEGNVIEDCIVTDYAGYYCTAISMGGGTEVFNSKWIEGTIRNNQVIGLHNPTGISTGIGFGAGALRDFVFEGNVTVGVDLAFNADTGRCRNLIFRNNRFLKCKSRGLSLRGRQLDNVIIDNNFFELDPRSRDWAIHVFDSRGVTRQTNYKIRNNVIRTAEGFFSSAGGILVSVVEGSNFIITGNRVESTLHNFFSAPDLVMFDNTDFAGNPLMAPQAPGNPIELPRGRGGTLLLDRGSAHRIVQAGDDPVENGDRLVAAYAEAAAMRPNGMLPSGTNRVTLLIMPGKYHLGSGDLALSAPFIDLIGMGHPQGTRLESDGNTLVQLADNVHLENLTLHCRSTVIPALSANDRAAYFPNPGFTKTVVRNCVFSAENQGWSMRLGVDYAGTYERCVSGDRGFGHLSSFSGSALDCRAGDFSFGSGGVFSGVATNCSAGVASFGGATTVAGGGFHGVARQCTAGDNSFGGSGWMIDCDVLGAISAAVPTTGKLSDCRIGPAPGNAAAIVVADGASLYNCTLVANPAGNGFSIDAAAPVAARVSHCRFNHGMRNVVNMIADPQNVDDPNID